MVNADSVRFLCVCQWGHSRSVAMARVLHSRGYPAVAIGQVSGGDAIIPLADWASCIVIMQPDFMGYIPVEHRAKVVLNDVGHDVWSNP